MRWAKADTMPGTSREPGGGAGIGRGCVMAPPGAPPILCPACGGRAGPPCRSAQPASQQIEALREQVVVVVGELSLGRELVDQLGQHLRERRARVAVREPELRSAADPAPGRRRPAGPGRARPPGWPPCPPTSLRAAPGPCRGTSPARRRCRRSAGSARTQRPGARPCLPPAGPGARRRACPRPGRPGRNRAGRRHRPLLLRLRAAQRPADHVPENVIQEPHLLLLQKYLLPRTTSTVST